ncbi:MAG TPA: hypothetical protein VGC25_07490 [Alphaproteobacteria bacterium]|jgi:hypothetical protein
MTFKIGQKVAIPCVVKPGAFSSESFVAMETVHGTVSGFVENELVQNRGGRHFLEGIVEEISDRTLTVRIHGSFFTTSGVADFDEDYLKAA